MCYTFYNCPTLLQYSTLPFLFFFLFEVQFWKFLLTFLSAHLFFPWLYLGEYLSPSKAFFICIPVVLISRIFLYGFLRVSLCLHYPSILAYFILFPSEVLAYWSFLTTSLKLDLQPLWLWGLLYSSSCSFCFVECFAFFFLLLFFFECKAVVNRPLYEGLSCY